MWRGIIVVIISQQTRKYCFDNEMTYLWHGCSSRRYLQTTTKKLNPRRQILWGCVVCVWERDTESVCACVYLHVTSENKKWDFLGSRFLEMQKEASCIYIQHAVYNTGCGRNSELIINKTNILLKLIDTNFSTSRFTIALNFSLHSSTFCVQCLLGGHHPPHCTGAHELRSCA